MSERFSRRSLFQASTGACLLVRQAPTRSFLVLQLLHPQTLIVRPVTTARLHCSDGRESWVVEGHGSVQMTMERSTLQVTGPGGTPVEFVMEVPAVVMRRSYRGTLRVSGEGEWLRPVVTMDVETATGSIVGAELPVADAALSALSAQAVVSRSVLLASPARPRHSLADFCDTTHCQFLRSPALAGGLVEQAVCSTRGLHLWQDGHAIFARYSGACGGVTESGKREGVRYEAVVCEACRRVGQPRRGHGWGLCQHGAMSLGRRGLGWREILALYYPHASIRSSLS